jgi:hypothetical protein
MGWGSAREIFDPVAQALVEANASSDVKRKVLGDLIKRLMANDWDTADESLEEFENDPDIMAAFADNEIFPPRVEPLGTLLGDHYGVPWNDTHDMALRLDRTIRKAVNTFLRYGAKP